MRMAVLRLQGPEADVVLGPCPGCQNWQVDYADEVANLLGVGPFREAVEHILQEHFAECRHLQLLLGDVQLA